MSLQKTSEEETYRLDRSERQAAVEAGTCDAIAWRLRIPQGSVEILHARNVVDRTVRHGDLAYLDVGINVSASQWQRLRFKSPDDPHVEVTGANYIELPEEHLAVLGGFAIGRPTEVRDFTRDMYGLPLEGHVAATTYAIRSEAVEYATQTTIAAVPTAAA